MWATVRIFASVGRATTVPGGPWPPAGRSVCLRLGESESPCAAHTARLTASHRRSLSLPVPASGVPQ